MSADRHCDRACELERAGQPAQAWAAYQQALAVDPTHYRSLFLSSLLLAGRGESALAAEHALRAVMANPSSA